MPMPVRMRASSRSDISRQRPPTSFSPIRSPPISTWPALGRSRCATQRSSVVLPDPLGPMIATFSPAAHREIDVLQDVDLAEALVRARRTSTQAVRIGRRVGDIGQANSDGEILRRDARPVR